MIAQRDSYDLAYLDDIPGTRCGPEDGPWPRSYQVLNDSEIWTELTHLARPQTVQLGTLRRADCINFQPCPRARTQDRYIVRQLNVHGRLWSLTGVFDGVFIPSSPVFL
jgi:pyruvate dehydrogenase phosphatase